MTSVSFFHLATTVWCVECRFVMHKRSISKVFFIIVCASTAFLGLVQCLLIGKEYSPNTSRVRVSQQFFRPKCDT